MTGTWSSGRRKGGRTGSKGIRVHEVERQWAAWRPKKVEEPWECTWILRLEGIWNEDSETSAAESWEDIAEERRK